MMSNLLAMRQKIDLIDAELVNILNERAKISLDISIAKRNDSISTDRNAEDAIQVYRPSREKEVYSKLLLLNAGPLKDTSLRVIFREIMSASIALQSDVSIAYLGSPCSFSYQAALERFGHSVVYTPNKRIKDIFESVEKGQTTFGIVPLENSIFGPVTETYDYLIHTSTKICAETYLKVHQCLLSNSKLEDISKVYSHEEGLGQTQKWLSANVTNATRIVVDSTSEAAEKASSEYGAAAVCSEICSEMYGLEIIEENIEDDPNNTTRFLIIGSGSDSPSADDHTLMRFTLNNRQPGAFCKLLNVFNDNGIQLFKVDTRPSGPSHYVYFIECLGHFKNEKMQKVIEELENLCVSVAVLGSFPNQS